MSSQSDVRNMVESEQGEVRIEDAKAEAVEIMYHNNEDEKMITSELLILADRYTVRALEATCVKHFKQNLLSRNALDVLISAYLTN